MRLQFDRGTLVLLGHPAGQELAKLPGVRWDPRVQRNRAPAYRYRAIVSSLRSAAIRFENGVRIPRPQAWNWRDIDLRPYQQAALLAWGREKQGMVALPTGSGKTRLACAAMAMCGACSLCLVPTRALLHQWRDEIRRHYAGAIGCLGDGERRIEDVTVATFEGAYRHMGRLGNRFGLLIVDEVHHFGTGIRDEALEMCAAPRRLALTATAPEGPALARILELMGPVVCELSIADLAGQWLAEFDAVVLRLRLTPDAQARYEAATRVFRDVFDQFRRFSKHVRWSDFVAMAARSAGGQAALEAFRYSRRLTSFPEAKRAALAELLARHRGNRILVFTSDNETAYTIARAEREQALSAFRSGELEVLVSAQVLNEGIDVPDADIAIIVGGLRGGREHVQRVGRLLRPLPGKRALVYELVMTGTHEVRKARERRRALLPAAVARDAG
jgi:superfamily II DNA or RNA helicase